MVDERYKEAPRNVVLDGRNAQPDLTPFRNWADAIQRDGALGIMQLSHPGRQSPLAVTGLFGPRPVAPSSYKGRVKLPGIL